MPFTFPMSSDKMPSDNMSLTSRLYHNNVSRQHFQARKVINATLDSSKSINNRFYVVINFNDGAKIDFLVPTGQEVKDYFFYKNLKAEYGRYAGSPNKFFIFRMIFQARVSDLKLKASIVSSLASMVWKKCSPEIVEHFEKLSQIVKKEYLQRKNLPDQFQKLSNQFQKLSNQYPYLFAKDKYFYIKFQELHKKFGDLSIEYKILPAKEKTLLSSAALSLISRTDQSNKILSEWSGSLPHRIRILSNDLQELSNEFQELSTQSQDTVAHPNSFQYFPTSLTTVDYLNFQSPFDYSNSNFPINNLPSSPSNYDYLDYTTGKLLPPEQKPFQEENISQQENQSLLAALPFRPSDNSAQDLPTSLIAEQNLDQYLLTGINNLNLDQSQFYNASSVNNLQSLSSDNNYLYDEYDYLHPPTDQSLSSEDEELLQNWLYEHSCSDNDQPIYLESLSQDSLTENAASPDIPDTKTTFHDFYRLA
jgi:hypothetical protein